MQNGIEGTTRVEPETTATSATSSKSTRTTFGSQTESVVSVTFSPAVNASSVNFGLIQQPTTPSTSGSQCQFWNRPLNLVRRVSEQMTLAPRTLQETLSKPIRRKVSWNQVNLQFYSTMMGFPLETKDQLTSTDTRRWSC